VLPIHVDASLPEFVLRPGVLEAALGQPWRVGTRVRYAQPGAKVGWSRGWAVVQCQPPLIHHWGARKGRVGEDRVAAAIPLRVYTCGSVHVCLSSMCECVCVVNWPEINAYACWCKARAGVLHMDTLNMQL